MKRIVVIGAGFAGLWSAIGAARKLDELSVPAGEVEVAVVNGAPFHSIRVRNYESELAATLVPLTDVLDPVGVRLIEGTVSKIDVANQCVSVLPDALDDSKPAQQLPYDRVVLAAGSRLVHPDIPGLAQYAFDVDSYAGACRLQDHLHSLSARGASPGRYTAVVVGAGLTGVELAAELPSRLHGIVPEADRHAIRVVLADRTAKIAQAMGGAQPVIERALTTLGVELLPGVSLKALDGESVELTDGTRIEAATVAWCGGMRASPLAAQFPVMLDALGRVPVDSFLRVEGVPDAFAAGDCARLLVDGVRASVMSCQHSRPMGRFAGHNVVCDLFGMPMLPLSIDWYTTILDLGPWGAVYTEGWDRQLVAEGAAAKKTKQTINCERIYPPRNRVRADILEAAAPVVQTPPPTRRASGSH
ncbi:MULTISPECIES: FAD-dependent oxidoreductase [unclassified Caballeronia]|uniref:NAD(P)/FAD-dependent oxidoreductase n=1 Tax=unclassified Caballeronia TaxID=2646786 RepID=UPI0028612B1F|nr:MULTISPECIES: FAD-dependent oxidoreductase [unclassified Caballeronia]MDR5753847.1 FAD-dependent oxidoreductase [Caballeronia sp. LZ024]MDR5840226.1 FAD-dependent oxidoreductase [Caballeronia sp. LZ031]